jgi:hypothetical protein
MSELTIIQDTREQNPWSFDNLDATVVTETLKTGDYSIVGYKNSFAIERKSLEDLVMCTYGDEHDRFRREIERAEDLDEFTVFIESPAWHLYDYTEKGGSPYYEADIHPNCTIGMIEKWPHVYDINGFKWSQNRANAALQTYETLKDWAKQY